jgi:hypothetical protein
MLWKLERVKMKEFAVSGAVAAARKGAVELSPDWAAGGGYPYIVRGDGRKLASG